MMTEEKKEIEKKWYVVRAVSGKEKKVKEQLEVEISRLNLEDYVSQVLIPTEKVYQIRNGKKISKERNFFPGYVLIEAALTGEIPHIVKNVTNVIGFLGATKGGDPVPMRQAEVNRILGKVDELADSDEEVNIPYIVGESVKVIDGPFNNFTGVIEEINEEKKKLKVMVKIFGRKTPLELNYMQVEKE
ncbi:transcription termination/antitermination protein NusG [Salibacter sp.]|jgi:transcriptional antiterminator NusG|uniref:transcription termination/antitermination protein NusG n=1 Tax=Salibacter sp. TaxID=2010995 RepID=UPI0038F61985